MFYLSFDAPEQQFDQEYTDERNASYAATDDNNMVPEM